MAAWILAPWAKALLKGVCKSPFCCSSSSFWWEPPPTQRCAQSTMGIIWHGCTRLTVRAVLDGETLPHLVSLWLNPWFCWSGWFPSLQRSEQQHFPPWCMARLLPSYRRTKHMPKPQCPLVQNRLLCLQNPRDFIFPLAVYSPEAPSAWLQVVLVDLTSTLNPQIPVSLHRGSSCTSRLPRLHFSIVAAAWLSAVQQFLFPERFANMSWLSLASPHRLPVGLKGPLRSTAAAQPRGAISFSIVKAFGGRLRDKESCLVAAEILFLFLKCICLVYLLGNSSASQVLVTTSLKAWELLCPSLSQGSQEGWCLMSPQL